MRLQHILQTKHTIFATQHLHTTHYCWFTGQNEIATHSSDKTYNFLNSTLTHNTLLLIYWTERDCNTYFRRNIQFSQLNTYTQHTFADLLDKMRLQHILQTKHTIFSIHHLHTTHFCWFTGQKEIVTHNT